MERKDTLTTIFEHNLWANLRLLERCAGLSAAQLETAVVGTFGSLRDTLEHIVTAEQAYLSRISTGQRYVREEGALPMNIPAMIAAARIIGQGLIAWAARVQAEDVVRIDWDGTPRAVPKTTILNQVINHATKHRAQVMAILTELGIEPPDLSGWAYFEEMDA